MEEHDTEENKKVAESSATGTTGDLPKKSCFECGSQEVKGQSSCSYKLLILTLEPLDVYNLCLYWL